MTIGYYAQKGVENVSDWVLLLPGYSIYTAAERINYYQETYKKRKQDSNIIEEHINQIIKDQQIGSTILVDTKQYLTLVLTQACSNCFQANQKWKIAKLELTVKYISKCLECKSYMTFNNEAEGMNYTSAYATAGLVGGVTRHALQNILASFGITSQICEKHIIYTKIDYFSNC
ncbi:hypothetical protein C2G38_2302615 [Gigaspora rosea]|uniref:Uncharacterized protein n=1 Tax=Gigaspora rosea TaxID=44941 RepID=A0A397VFK9_9GLOM|nr:hypothetical protein C2G38_2302615 [Gigaspora rosea]